MREYCNVEIWNTIISSRQDFKTHSRWSEESEHELDDLKSLRCHTRCTLRRNQCMHAEGLDWWPELRTLWRKVHMTLSSSLHFTLALHLSRARESTQFPSSMKCGQQCYCHENECIHCRTTDAQKSSSVTLLRKKQLELYISFQDITPSIFKLQYRGQSSRVLTIFAVPSVHAGKNESYRLD